MYVKQKSKCSKVEEEIWRVQARLSNGKEGEDRGVVRKRNLHTRKQASSKWAVNEMLN